MDMPGHEPSKKELYIAKSYKYLEKLNFLQFGIKISDFSTFVDKIHHQS